VSLKNLESTTFDPGVRKTHVYFQHCDVKSVIFSNRTIENTFAKTTEKAELFSMHMILN